MTRRSPTFQEAVNKGQTVSSAQRLPCPVTVAPTEHESNSVDIKGGVPAAITVRTLATQTVAAFMVSNDDDTYVLLHTPDGVPYTVQLPAAPSQVALDPRYLLGFRFVKVASVTIDGNGDITGNAAIASGAQLDIVTLP